MSKRLTEVPLFVDTSFSTKSSALLSSTSLSRVLRFHRTSTLSSVRFISLLLVLVLLIQNCSCQVQTNRPGIIQHDGLTVNNGTKTKVINVRADEEIDDDGREGNFQSKRKNSDWIPMKTTVINSEDDNDHREDQADSAIVDEPTPYVFHHPDPPTPYVFHHPDPPSPYVSTNQMFAPVRTQPKPKLESVVDAMKSNLASVFQRSLSRFDYSKNLGYIFDKFQPLWGNKEKQQTTLDKLINDPNAINQYDDSPATPRPDSRYGASSSPYSSRGPPPPGYPPSPYSSPYPSGSPYHSPASPYASASSPYASVASPYASASSPYASRSSYPYPPPPSASYPPSPYPAASSPYASRSPYSYPPPPPPPPAQGYRYRTPGSGAPSPYSPYPASSSARSAAYSPSASYNSYAYQRPPGVPLYPPPPPVPGSYASPSNYYPSYVAPPTHGGQSGDGKSRGEQDSITIGGIGSIMKMLGGVSFDGKNIRLNSTALNLGAGGGNGGGSSSGSPSPFIKIGDLGKISFKPSSKGLSISFGPKDEK